ncbi:hypothetical protein GH714_018970 [Hevea brasiliensis]|uniref:Endoglucanase n=1 Tax=Hevea brasiliensis TaxID=3981 RepID=A0A6A6MYK4_HEVBR|nr:hypothetical protein GH714_018970 [Hevea brasiliensis]
MSMYGRDPWGGPLEINAADSATDDDRSRNLQDLDRAALSRPLDETQQSWLLGPTEQKRRRNTSISVVSSLVARSSSGLSVLFSFPASWLVSLLSSSRLCLATTTLSPLRIITLLLSTRHSCSSMPNDVMFFSLLLNLISLYKLRISSDLISSLFDAIYSAGKLPKHNNVSWREYSAKYEAAGELNHVKDIIKWGTDYFLKCFNHTADTINTIAAQVGSGDTSGGNTSPNDHYCWMRPEDIDYPRSVTQCSSCSDLAAEMAAALASASIVFKDNKAYSQKLVHGAKTLFKFARGQRAWLYYATGNNTYLQLATTRGLAKHAGAFSGGPYYGVLSWDNKLTGAQVLLSRLRLFLSPGYPYEEILRTFHNQTSIIMCSYLPIFTSFNRTKGGLIQLNHGAPQPLQYVVNAAFLATLFSDYLEAADTPGWYCGPNFYSTDVLREFAKTQVDYILGKNPRKMSYVVGFGNHYPRHVHHRGASIRKDKIKYNCKGGWKWRDSSKPNPNTLVGAMVAGPDKHDGFHDVRTNYNYTEPTLAGNAGLVAALVALSGDRTTGIDKNTIFSAVPPMFPTPPPPPAPWKP